MPCWQDKNNARQEEALRTGMNGGKGSGLEEPEEPEVFVSLVVPAYNEEERLNAMLTEAVDYLRSEYGNANGKSSRGNGRLEEMTHRKKMTNGGISKSTISANPATTGWEVLIVSDGSTDKTIEIALNFARQLDNESASAIRVIALQENRGKGGAVTHGMRHVRGQYAIFADADGASKFEDLGKLLQACTRMKDKDGRAVAVGSRNHLVGSEAVVKVRKAFRKSRCMALIELPALFSPQPSHALLPSFSTPSNPSRHGRNSRYPVRF